MLKEHDMRLHASSSALLALALTLGSSFATTTEDRLNDAVTAWQWRYGQTAAQISTTINQGYRAVDIEVESSSPLRFSAAFVRNTGSYNDATWWYHGLSVSELSSKCSQLGARINDLEIYLVNGERKCAALLSRNTGAEKRGWAWRTLIPSANELVSYGLNNNLRPIDVEHYSYNGNSYYAAVYVNNSGSQQLNWWFYGNRTSTEVKNLISSRGARLIDIHRRSNGRHDIILYKTPGYWWWGTVRSEAELKELYGQKGARITGVQTYVLSNKRYFTFVLNDNLNTRSRRIAQILSNGTDGRYGHYIKRVGGSTLASLRSDFQFEPASLLKTLHHAHVMRLVRLGQAKLSDMILVYQGMNGSCPDGTNPVLMTLEQCLSLMMKNSSNPATKAIADRYGFAALNSRAQHLGMSDTLVQHNIGCGSEASIKPNRLTLEDLGQLHEQVCNGYLLNQTDKFRELMLDSVNNYASPRSGTRLSTIIAQEASKLGLSNALRDAFIANAQIAYKTGRYGLGGLAYCSAGGWVRLPIRSGQGMAFREYVTGAFNDGASNGTNSSSAVGTACTELLRESIASALATWKGYTPGSFIAYGSGCKSSTGQTLSQTASGLAELTQNARYTMLNAPTFTPAICWIGFSRTSYGPLPLPFGLAAFGANGCSLRCDPAIALVGATGSRGTMTRTLPLPANKSLIGQRFYTQFWSVDARANQLGIAFSNGVETRIGGSK
jgi:beta-lactamase class A